MKDILNLKNLNMTLMEIILMMVMMLGLLIQILTAQGGIGMYIFKF